MNLIIPIFLSLIIFISCKTENEKDPSFTSNNINYLVKKTDIFNFSKEPLWSTISIRSYDSKEVNKDNLVKDSILSNIIKEDINLYELYYYSPMLKNETMNVFTLVAGYDYSLYIFLVSEIDDKIIDYKILAEHSGDGGDFYGKSSILKNGEFISDFEESYRTFTCPIDTTTYYKKGKSRIYIDSKGKINEDTLEIKRNFIMTERNSDCDS